MAWYWWTLIVLQVLIDLGLVFFVWVAVVGSMMTDLRADALLAGMRAVAKNVDQRFAWNETTTKDVIHFLTQAFGQPAPKPPGEPPKGEGLPN